MKKLFSIGSYHFFRKKWKNKSGWYRYSHFYNLPKATYSPWLEDEDFKEIYQVASENTLVDVYRCYELWHLAKQTNKLKGDVLEVGVWKGGTGSLLAAAVTKNATVYLCDTFKGVVKAGEKDNQYVGGEHSDTSVDIVKQLFERLNLSNYEILRGIFPEHSSSAIEDKIFSLCHIDVDVYQSAKEIFLWVWQRMALGGIVVFDDYGFAACEGITELVNNELANRNDLIMLHNLNGHAILIKTL